VTFLRRCLPGPNWVKLRRNGTGAAQPLSLQQRKSQLTGRHSRSVPTADFRSSLLDHTAMRRSNSAGILDGVCWQASTEARTLVLNWLSSIFFTRQAAGSKRTLVCTRRLAPNMRSTIRHTGKAAAPSRAGDPAAEPGVTSAFGVIGPQLAILLRSDHRFADNVRTCNAARMGQRQARADHSSSAEPVAQSGRRARIHRTRPNHA